MKPGQPMASIQPMNTATNPKSKLNLTIREEQQTKLRQIATVEMRSISNLIEVMADERYNQLVKALGSKTVKDLQ